MTDSTRTILARNIRALIQASSIDGSRVSLRSWAIARGLDVRLIDRLSKGEHAVTLDKLEEIARACGLKAWHLLLEDFDPKGHPDAPITEEERQLLSRLKKLLG